MAAPHTEAPAEEHSSFIKTPQQLVVVVVLAFVIPIMIITLLAKLVTTGGGKYDEKHPAMSDEAVAARIKPVGQVSLGEAGAGATVAKTGEEIYKQVCSACHAAGVLNAPKLGDQAAWAPRLKQGIEVMVADSIKGIRQMPPRGGNPDLSDLDMRRAVVYMANQAGANWKEPEAQAPAGAPAAAAAAGDKIAAAAPASGKSVYDGACVACHAAGVAGAPKTGDKTAWAPRIKQGMDALYASSLKGKGAMPPKGGNAQLSDADVKAAVDYLVGLAK